MSGAPSLLSHLQKEDYDSLSNINYILLSSWITPIMALMSRIRL